MQPQEEYNRIVAGNAVLEEGLKITVALAQSWVERGLMTEAEVIKYFNITRQVYDQFKQKSD